ncbi:MAG: hypothetical protein JW900_11645 [Anaerolineae bacterium]|nr:hypothetical protein [Anaerolineae bacterium]
MSQIFDTLQRRYRDLVSQGLTEERGKSFPEDVNSLMNDIRLAGEGIIDPGERSQLRAYMRFLATIMSEAGQELPKIDLLPPDKERWSTLPAATGTRAVIPPWVWALVGAAALVIAAGLVARASSSLGRAAAPPTLTPPPTTTLPPSPTSPPAPTATNTPTPTPTAAPTLTAQPPSPAFSGLTIALGVSSSGEPLLTGNEFDWNTKVVYAVFDYACVQQDMEWSVVWSRNEQEIARENHLWDVARDGAAGTQWAIYFDPDGSVLSGGAYTVSLYVDGALQAEAAFRIRYYIPSPTPTP